MDVIEFREGNYKIDILNKYMAQHGTYAFMDCTHIELKYSKLTAAQSARQIKHIQKYKHISYYTYITCTNITWYTCTNITYLLIILSWIHTKYKHIQSPQKQVEAGQR